MNMPTLSDRRTQALKIGPAALDALLAVPPDARGLVIFAHGSGSGRLSPRNNHVADGLHLMGLGTLLLDLLSPDEEAERANVFDIALLASRLFSATEWASQNEELNHLPFGYFGASTGAGAAILAASGPDRRIRAIVSRGGRIDLAGDSALAQVRAPVQVIVGSLDLPVLGLTQTAMQLMHCDKELVVIPGAGHLFEEPGTLDRVIDHAGQWFHTHFPDERQDA